MEEPPVIRNLCEGRLYDLAPHQKRALIIGSYEGSRQKLEVAERLDESERLCQTFGLETVMKLPINLRSIDATTYIGSGKVEEIKQLCIDHEIDVVLFDDEISPQQQRNLEKIIETSVIDRSELILGIFGQRAQTREAKIQVELAAARYQLPRLRGIWKGLNRQKTGGGKGAGGGGYLKGEGETRLEIDRRILRSQIDQLEKELKEVIKNRGVQRQARIRSGLPSFAIIGYTNAGKSTLLKALTNADVLVEDKLFATLDTTTRKFTLPNNQEILLVDTVGFIRKLPHLLVAAFKGTLEEAAQADILLHIVDVGNSEAFDHAKTSLEVLEELGASDKPIITVLNKVDTCQNPLIIEKMRLNFPDPVEISALTRNGIDQLLDRMIKEISRLRKVVNLRIPQSQYGLVSEIMREGKVLSTEYEDNDVLLEVEIPKSYEKKIAPYEVEK